MTSKPTILLIPGSFSHASMYYPLQDAIQAQGYECFVNNAPSASRNPPEEPATLEDDAVFFRGLIEKLADQGKDVVVVGHSYGGIIATEAAKGAAKSDRQASGKQGGIVKIVYLSAIVLPEGGSNLKDYGEPPEALVSVGEDGFMRITGVEICAQATFNDWPYEKALEMTKTMTRHSAPSFASTLTYPAYKHIPCAYIFCEHDMIIPPEKQQQYANQIKEGSGKEVEVHKLPTGHCPTLTATNETAKVIVDIANSA
ncbi:hypothetical protein LTR67_006255 [Exophiala xenobiotica]|nr:hypothetical protein H2202_010570 [Exophiala xenobiotica]KAK5212346.1 hypothetical protein LTR41_002588 [Exophiala xenobiotica]KAK5219570.1 hypothetical protein LTR72_007954 [Exophiala xenobiotica]KAK5231702.1 hypothetical protein LTR47_007105 [Exophiala xenobiotica]KAK5252483.1 hypothetical protein LTS06_002890 [Exophiala xenobiotica]